MLGTVREGQWRYREVRSERSLEQSCEPRDTKRIEGRPIGRHGMILRSPKNTEESGGKCDVVAGKDPPRPEKMSGKKKRLRDRQSCKF